ncbi:hypothetical protein JCM21900_005023, partial [Sporobolomyces salmonicolor]
VADQEGTYLGKKFTKLAKSHQDHVALDNGIYDDPDDLLYHPFNYRHMGSLAYIGNSAVFDIESFSFAGGLAAMYLWRSVYLSEAVSLRTRCLLLLDWIKRGTFGRDLSRCPIPLPYQRRFHPSPRRQLFGWSLPVPSNDPLAGTTPDASGPPWLFVLQVFVGLPAVLWAYKCLMLVLFQRKIVYLPSVPLGTRNESLADGERTRERDASLSGVNWKEVTIPSEAPTRLLRQKVELKGIELSGRTSGESDRSEGRRHIVIVYLQGNAGTPLMRIPLFRQLLRSGPSPSANVPRSAPTSGPSSSPSTPHLTILAVAPRSFWRSTRSTPTEASFLADYSAVLSFASERYGPSARLVLYGHSLGGAVAVLLLERLSQLPFPAQPSLTSQLPPPIAGLVLENPLPSIPYMVRALYPQKWLPYHYLGFAAFDRWDAIGRLTRLAKERAQAGTPERGTGRGRSPVPSLWIRSGRDEIIPNGEDDGVRTMFEAWRAIEAGGGDGGERSQWVDVHGALHDTAYTEKRWRDTLLSFLQEVAEERSRVDELRRSD